jgi:hypothetical protein
MDPTLNCLSPLSRRRCRGRAPAAAPTIGVTVRDSVLARRRPGTLRLDRLRAAHQRAPPVPERRTSITGPERAQAWRAAKRLRRSQGGVNLCVTMRATPGSKSLDLSTEGAAQDLPSHLSPTKRGLGGTPICCPPNPPSSHTGGNRCESSLFESAAYPEKENENRG